MLGLLRRVGFVLGLLVAPSLASAQQPSSPPKDAQQTGQGDERARTHFESGQNHYEAGAYEAAIREFEAAYDLSGKTGLLYNLYLAHERAGNLERAEQYLGQYLDQGELGQDRRQMLEQRLQNLRQRIESEQGPAAQAPSQPAPARKPTSETAGLPASATASFVLAGVGIATFAVFAGLSEAEDQSLADDCGVDALKVCSDDDVSKLRAYNITADVGLGVGLAAAASGVLFWLLDRGEESESAQDMAVAPWLGPTRAGASAQVRF
jgi:tetratricopeptide (TPR) repeat protein